MEADVKSGNFVSHGGSWYGMNFGIVARALDGGLSIEVSLNIIFLSMASGSKVQDISRKRLATIF